jgi:pyridoxal phosphate enzyme (YggS family)
VDPPTLQAGLRNRLAGVEARIEAACLRAGRSRAELTLVAVTKTVASEVAALLPELGVTDLGESRPQELWRKAQAVPGVRWHLVGHLQRNKVERTLPLVHLVHSADSRRLLEALEEEGKKRATSTDVLLEVNASREPRKHGFRPEEVPGLVPWLPSLQHVSVRGLMTMAAFADDPERCRPTFHVVRELRDRLWSALGPPHKPEHLSMGMTNDFEVAIEEGATLVRIGTALFEGLDSATGAALP